MYTWPRFLRPNAVYMKTAVDWRLFNSVEQYRQPSTYVYIGPTSISVANRESNRMSTLKQLELGKENQAELSVRCWHSTGSFESFSTIQISVCESYRQAWILEHMLIDSWQPKLNHRFITLSLQRTALGFRANSKTRKMAYAKFGRRLWIKLRKKLHPSPQPNPMRFNCPGVEHGTFSATWQV